MLILKSLLLFQSCIQIIHKINRCLINLLDLLAANRIKRHNALVYFCILLPLVPLGPALVAGTNIFYVFNLMGTQDCHYVGAAHVVVLVEPAVAVHFKLRGVFETVFLVHQVHLMRCSAKWSSRLYIYLHRHVTWNRTFSLVSLT